MAEYAPMLIRWARGFLHSPPGAVEANRVSFTRDRVSLWVIFYGRIYLNYYGTDAFFAGYCVGASSFPLNLATLLA